ncbi:hypothetical protein [Parasphingorhabdus sp.]|uniref:hypothetical protein n=1 Tax=Parasphingorhabdus sp. TaxID=2709688 RepID=UPI003267C650
MQYEDAISFAGNIRDIEKFRGFRDRPDPNVIDWWPKKIPSSAIGSSGDINVKDDPYVDIAVVKDGQSADVFLYSWTM